MFSCKFGTFLLETYIGKSSIISESFSLLLKSPKKKVPNHNPTHYSTKEKMLRVLIWLLFWQT